MEKVYEKKVYVKAFQFDGNAIIFAHGKNIPLWAVAAYKDRTIKKRNEDILYIDHKEHTDFVKKEDYIIQSEFGHIFSLPKADFENMYALKGGWIPCSERLPDKDGEYICTQRIYNLSNGKLSGKSVELVEFCNGKWRRAKHLKVIAWQPLPEEYHE